MLARPDPNTLRAAAVEPTRDGRLGPHVLRHREPSTASRSPATPARCCAATSTGRGPRLHVLRRSRDGVLLLRRRRPDEAAPAPRPGRLLRPHHGRRRLRPAPPHALDARGDGHPRRVLASTRTRRASTRSTCATPTPSTMADNIMMFRLWSGRSPLEHGVYATFMPKPLERRAGLGDAHATCRCSRATRNAFHDPRPVRSVHGGPAVHRRPAAPRPGDHRGHQPAGELATSAWSSGNEAPPYVTWAHNNRSALRAGAAHQAARPPRPASSTGRPTRPATPTWPSR